MDNFPKLYVRTSGDKAICIRLIKKEHQKEVPPRCVTPPPVDPESPEILPATSSTSFDSGKNSSQPSTDSSFVQNAIEVEQDQLCVFSGNEPMKTNLVYDEQSQFGKEPLNDSASCIFSLKKMRVRYDGDEGVDEESAADDNNFDFDESLLVRASDMLPSTMAASALNMIPLMPIEDELITKPWLKPKKSKPANGVKPKTINRWKTKNPQSIQRCQKVFRKVVERLWAKEQEFDSDDERDPFNLSNDKYYSPIMPNVGDFSNNVMLHSIPAQNLSRTLFPTHYTVQQLRNFHRWPLEMRSKSKRVGFQSVESLEKHIENVAKLREEHRLESGGGAMFFMHDLDDLTSKDGDLILCEYSEEHPPLMMQPGMTTKMKNLYKKTAGQTSLTNVEPHFEYGETTFVKSSPLLGNLNADEVLQILDNNLFRAPLYLHDFPETDFLIVRDSNGYFIRVISNIYCVGQECPVYEVPAPNSQKAAAFTRDFLLAFIYRLFWKSHESPRRLKSEILRQAFPNYADSSIRKRLKSCATFTRLGSGVEFNYWLLKNDFRLPSLEQIQQLITPEMYCAYFSMCSAEQRLKDAGYGDDCGLFTIDDDAVDHDDDDEESKQPKMDDEIKCAPWNTTRAYISAIKGKCLLDLTGVADPTGRGEGFSFVKVSSKAPSFNSSTQKRPAYFYGTNKICQVDSLFENSPPTSASVKRVINGTDADLRKLSLNDARQLLKDLGVKEKEIRALKRWEVIDVIRTFSTHQARAGDLGLTKFARGSTRMSATEIQERYKQECQRIFDLQNRILSCAEYMSTDDEEDESDVEEVEVREVSQPVRKKNGIKSEPKDDYEDFVDHSAGRNVASTSTATTNENRKLKIFRTYRAADGREYVNVEVVTQSQLIDAYLKVRKSKDDEFITKFAQEDKQYKIEKRKEKRRLQDKLRRIKRNQLKAQMGLPVGRTKRPPKPPKPIKASLLKMRCSACNGKGHMKTNKHCPLYKGNFNESSSSADVNNSETNEVENGCESSSQNYVSIEGTKMSISKKFFARRTSSTRRSGRKDSDEYTSEEDNLSSSGADVDDEQADETSTATPVTDDEDVIDRPKKQINRRRTDPKVELNLLMEKIVDELKSSEVAEAFLRPVSRKSYPDYYTIISKPMNLSTIKVSLSKNLYASSAEFLDDVRQIAMNARRYNGDEHEIAKAAEKLYQLTTEKLNSQLKTVKNLERLIDPLIGDDDVTLFCRELNRIVEKCQQIKKVVQLSLPENRKKFKSYFDTIVEPIDLNEIQRKCTSKQYVRVDDFVADVEKIQRNSEIFNGSTSAITGKAMEVVDLTKTLISQNSDRLASLERRLTGLIKGEPKSEFNDERPPIVVENPTDPSKSNEATMTAVAISSAITTSASPPPPLPTAAPTDCHEFVEEMSEIDRRLGNFLPDHRRFERQTRALRIKKEKQTSIDVGDQEIYDIPLDISDGFEISRSSDSSEPERKRRRVTRKTR